MKLVNQTALPDVHLRVILTQAARDAKAKTAGVGVKILWGSSRSRANRNNSWIRLRAKRRGQVRYLENLRGTVTLYLGRPDAYRCCWIIDNVTREYRHPSSVLDWALGTYRTMVHEWVHIADGQEGLAFGDYDLPWCEREHEQRAQQRADLVMQRMGKRTEEAVLALGIMGEEWTASREQRSR